MLYEVQVSLAFERYENYRVTNSAVGAEKGVEVRRPAVQERFLISEELGLVRGPSRQLSRIYRSHGSRLCVHIAAYVVPVWTTTRSGLHAAFVVGCCKHDERLISSLDRLVGPSGLAV